jgi:DNA invertase Pin-like site-specific DNA recombinase
MGHLPVVGRTVTERCIKKGVLPNRRLAWTSEVKIAVAIKDRFMIQSFKIKTSEETMRVALYARVSTKDGRQDTENQLLQLRAFAATQGWTVTAEYIDRVSGGKGVSEREQFQKMFTAASKREFDILLFWSLDRLSREGTVATLNHLERLNGYGVNYRSFTEQYLDSTGIFKEAVIGILAAVARQERIRLSERTIAGLQRAKAKGATFGRPKAEDNFQMMKSLYRLRDQGKSIREIAKELKLSTGTVHKACKMHQTAIGNVTAA